MKTKLNTVLAFLLIFAGLISCDKDKLPPNPVTPPTEETPTDTLDTPENCGCGDNNYSITDILGTIRYRISAHPDDPSTHHKFWITEGGSGIYTHEIICNDNILPQEILKLKNEKDTITKLNVVYSGNLKNTCKEMPSGVNNGSQVYFNIYLTKIKIQ